MHAPPPPLPTLARTLPSPHHPYSYEEYVPLKTRRQREEAERLARVGRAPQPTSSADTGGGGRSGGGTDTDGEVDHRQGKESLLIMKAKKMQEVRGRGRGRQLG